MTPAELRFVKRLYRHAHMDYRPSFFRSLKERVVIDHDAVSIIDHDDRRLFRAEWIGHDLTRVEWSQIRYPFLCLQDRFDDVRRAVRTLLRNKAKEAAA